MSLLKSIATITLNALFISTCIAGVEARTGQRIKTQSIENEQLRSGLDYVLSWGDTILVAAGNQMAKYPDYFEHRIINLSKSNFR